jgi:hypothetical protein
MSTLDDAILAHMTHGAGACADPLTDCMLDQVLPQHPALRPGWEDEPVNPPVHWRLLAAVAAATVLASALLSGCGGGSDEDDGQSSTQPVNCAATPETCK